VTQLNRTGHHYDMIGYRKTKTRLETNTVKVENTIHTINYA